MLTSVCWLTRSPALQHSPLALRARGCRTCAAWAIGGTAATAGMQGQQDKQPRVLSIQSHVVHGYVGVLPPCVCLCFAWCSETCDVHGT